MHPSNREKVSFRANSCSLKASAMFFEVRYIFRNEFCEGVRLFSKVIELEGVSMNITFEYNVGKNYTYRASNCRIRE